MNLPMVDGTVGFFSLRKLIASDSFFPTSWLFGSTVAANFKFVTVYSWPQNTF